jgi:hypothetical protein
MRKTLWLSSVLAVLLIVPSAVADNRGKGNQKDRKEAAKDRREAVRESAKERREIDRERDKEWREYLKEERKADKEWSKATRKERDSYGDYRRRRGLPPLW